MIRNYFKILFRTIKRSPVYSLLNVAGLAIGMTCVFLILLWVKDEWSYDRHFKNAENLYRVVQNQNYDTDPNPLELTPEPLAPALKKEYPEIIRSSRYSSFEITLQKDNEPFNEVFAFVDPDFLEMFSIQFVQGDIRTALNGPFNIVITEEMAKKYFKGEDPLGKTLTIYRFFTFTITGLIKELPHNSHIKFDFLVPYEFNKAIGRANDMWSTYSLYSYIELYPGTDTKLLGNKIKNIIERNDAEVKTEIFLQNIKKVYLFSSVKHLDSLADNKLGNITYVRVYSLIALFIMLIACINFTNLSIAQYSKRAKEIGMRKISGAQRNKIIFQFLGESFFLAFVAHIMAMIMVEVLLPGFNNLSGKQLFINYKGIELYATLLFLIFLCGVMAGFYPALILSSFKPLDAISDARNKITRSSGFRKALVIFQFSLSAFLITSTFIIRNQINYLHNKKLGIETSNIGYFEFVPGFQIKAFKDKLYQNPDIIYTTVSNQTPANINTSTGCISWEGQNENIIGFHILAVDEDFAETFKLELKEGRFFSTEFLTDSATVVINEKAAEIIGHHDQIIYKIKTGYGDVDRRYKIAGVAKDFHYNSLRNALNPLIMFLEPMTNGGFCFIRMNTENICETTKFIEDAYQSFNPSKPMDFRFLDKDFENLYRNEQRMGIIFNLSSFLAIIVSCLGLIGLSNYMTESRTKEIGIRKANGAKSIEIFSQLSREFFILVIISFAIASPIAWYTMHKWLQNFAYRVNIGWWVFALTGISVLIITMLTIGFQSYKAASKNPVDALRYE